MKFFAFLALTIAAANAIALPEPVAQPEAEASCNKPHQPCWKAKRAAEAFAEIFDESNIVEREAEPSCNKPHQPCWKAKRNAEALADALANAQDGTTDYFSSLNLERSLGEEETSLEARSAEPEAEASCNKPHQPCWKAKREAQSSSCNKKFQPCWKVKRAAEAVSEIIAREPQGMKKGGPCNKPHQPCPRVKREAEASCNKPHQPCWRAKRDLEAVQHIARYILDAPEAL